MISREGMVETGALVLVRVLVLYARAGAATRRHGCVEESGLCYRAAPVKTLLSLASLPSAFPSSFRGPYSTGGLGRLHADRYIEINTRFKVVSYRINSRTKFIGYGFRF